MKQLISVRNMVKAGNVVVLDEKNPQIRNSHEAAREQRSVHHGRVGVSR